LQIPELRTYAITLFASAGIFVAMIGLAAQQAFSNIISGFFIVMFKPFRVDDVIKVGDLDYGIVEDITLRHTVINDFKNNRIVIPNSVIGAATIINNSLNDKKICKWIDFGISYDSDIELATEIIQEEAMKHPFYISNLGISQLNVDEYKVEVRLVSFGDFSINLRAFVWTDDPLKVGKLQSDLNKVVKKRFDKEGIEIPYPYRTLVFKKDLPKNQIK